MDAGHVTRAIEFGPYGLRMDLYRSALPDSPVALYVHGGGFAGGSRASDAKRIEALVDAGLTIASIDYRLAPEARYPAAVEDVLDAAHALSDRADLSHPRSVGAIGASAGGYLAAMAALRPGSPIGAVSPWFAVFDLVASSRRTPLESKILPITFEANLVGEPDPERLRAVSVTNHNLDAAPPFLLVHGDRDKIVPMEQSVAMHEALVHAGRSSSLLRVGGAGHEDPAFDGGPLVQLVAGWMRGVLGSPHATV